MKAKVTLFYSESCGFCGPARKEINSILSNRKDFELIEMTADTYGAQEFVEKHGIQSTPTFIIEGVGYPDPIGLRGGQSNRVLNKYIDIALGKEKLEKKIGMFDKLFESFGL